MKLLVCFLEEPSAKEMLQIIVPRLQPSVESPINSNNFTTNGIIGYKQTS